MKMSMEGVQPWSAGSLPAGVFTSRLDDVQVGKSSGGHPQVELSWTVLAGEFQGAEIRDFMVVPSTEAGQQFFLSKLLAVYTATAKDAPKGDFELDDVRVLIGGLANVIRRKDEDGYIPKDKDQVESNRVFPVRVAGYAKASAQAISAAGPEPTSEAQLPF